MSLNSTFQTTASATGQDFSRWQSHAKTLTASQLRFAISDCQKAREAMLQRDTATGRVFNQVKADFYLDQLITFKDELIERAINR
jgi:hypothetical protein